MSTKVFNTMIAITAAIILLLFLWSYSETGSPPVLLSKKPENINPAFYLINAKNTQFDAQGALEMVIKSDSVQHQPVNNSSLIKQPRIALYKDGILNWTVRSKTGVAYQSNERIDLQQQVIIASGDNQTVLKTPYLELYPNEKRAETDQPVTMHSPTGFTRSIGLKANMQTKQVNLLNKVRGQYNAIP